MYNLLVVTPDQLRADYLGCYGHPTIGTSHIDHLADEGVRFSQCYCAAPLCGPSRISFATSTYVGEHGHRNYGSTISPSVPNLVTSLHDAGYRTGMFGKNHLFTYGRLPEIWDELDEICLGNYDGHPEYRHAFSAFPLDAEHPFNITGRLTDEAIDFMGRTEQPFFAWVNFQDPHPAFTCPPPYATLFSPDDVQLPPSWRTARTNTPVRNAVWRQHSEMPLATDEDMRRAIAMYMGQVRYVDDSVGRLLAALEANGQLHNTVILFFADHGELLGDHGMTHKLPAFYDCLTRIPVILRHPDGRWRGTTFSGLVEEIDLAPTLLSLMDVPIPITMVGKPLCPALDRGDSVWRDSVLCEAGGGAATWQEADTNLRLYAPFEPTSYGPGAMVRNGEWKLSLYADDIPELYNLAEDPHEMHNRYGDPAYREIREKMTTLLARRLLGVKMRDVRLDWPYDAYPWDVRFEPLEREDWR